MVALDTRVYGLYILRGDRYMFYRNYRTDMETVDVINHFHQKELTGWFVDKRIEHLGAWRVALVDIDRENEIDPDDIEDL